MYPSLPETRHLPLFSNTLHYMSLELGFWLGCFMELRNNLGWRRPRRSSTRPPAQNRSDAIGLLRALPKEGGLHNLPGQPSQFQSQSLAVLTLQNHFLI